MKAIEPRLHHKSTCIRKGVASSSPPKAPVTNRTPYGKTIKLGEHYLTKLDNKNKDLVKQTFGSNRKYVILVGPLATRVTLAPDGTSMEKQWRNIQMESNMVFFCKEEKLTSRLHAKYLRKCVN